MREIEFRAKQIENNEWVHGDLLTPKGLCVDYEISDLNSIDGSRVEINKKTIGQFTGLLDKNLNKIFVGDIVKFNNQIGEIVFELGSFGIEIKEGLNYKRLEKFINDCLNNSFSGIFNDNFIPLMEIYWNLDNTDNFIDEIEIIGNIHDNPELLEVQP